MKLRYIMAFGLLSLVVSVALITAEHLQEQQQHIEQIVGHIEQQDSVINVLNNANQKLLQAVASRDSIRLQNEQMIKKYERSMDSVSLILQYLQRADVPDSYRPKK